MNNPKTTSTTGRQTRRLLPQQKKPPVVTVYRSTPLRPVGWCYWCWDCFGAVDEDARMGSAISDAGYLLEANSQLVEIIEGLIGGLSLPLPFTVCHVSNTDYCCRNDVWHWRPYWRTDLPILFQARFDCHKGCSAGIVIIVNDSTRIGR